MFQKFFANLATSRSRSETLIEVVIALGVISIAAATAAHLSTQAIHGAAFARDSLVAQNLAMEGLEFVRHIRDTNKIRFGNPTCWNYALSETLCPSLSTAVVLENATYILTKDKDGKDLFTKPAAAFIPTNPYSTSSNEPYRLYYYDLDKTVDSDKDASNSPTNDRDIILNKITDLTGSSITELPPTKFFREIKLDFYEIGGPSGTDNAMRVTSSVHWLGPNKLETVSVSGTLTNNL